jgi:hypothetical protein
MLVAMIVLVAARFAAQQTPYVSKQSDRPAPLDGDEPDFQPRPR